MGKVVALNQQDVSDEITLLTDSTGVPTTGVLAAAAGHTIWYQRDENNAVITDGGSAADMTSITDIHTDWEFKHAQAGSYRVDLPDAAFLEGASILRWGMYATGITGITREIIINPLFKFQGKASSVTAGTTTFPAGTNPYGGDEIVVTDGTGIKQTRLITSVSGQVATHDNWDVNISSTTSTILLLAGDSHITFLDVSVASRSVVTTGDLASETSSILARLPAALVNGTMDCNVSRMNDNELFGAGTALDKWRGTA